MKNVIPITVLFVGLVFPSWSDADMKRLPEIRSFICYYGPDEVDEMARYDLVILEPGQHEPEAIGRIKAQGATVVGYISLGEILEEPRTETFTRTAESDPAVPPYYLDADGDGELDRNPGWGGLYVDTRSPAWVERVVKELVPHIIDEQGVDGLFLDTLDTVDAFPKTKQGMVGLVRSIRKAYPDIPIVANRGFSILDGMAPFIDGVLFEAFTTRFNPETKQSKVHSDSDLEWVDGVLEKIRRAGRNQIEVLVLDYASRPDTVAARRARERAEAAGLAWSLTTGSLDRLPMDGGPGKPRPLVKSVPPQHPTSKSEGSDSDPDGP